MKLRHLMIALKKEQWVLINDNKNKYFCCAGDSYIVVGDYLFNKWKVKSIIVDNGCINVEVSLKKVEENNGMLFL